MQIGDKIGKIPTWPCVGASISKTFAYVRMAGTAIVVDICIKKKAMSLQDGWGGGVPDKDMHTFGEC